MFSSAFTKGNVKRNSSEDSETRGKPGCIQRNGENKNKIWVNINILYFCMLDNT